MWKKVISRSANRTFDFMTATQLDEETQGVVTEFVKAISSENYVDITRPEYENLLTMLRGISANRAELGFTPTETAAFILGFKEVINTVLEEKVRTRRIWPPMCS